MEDHLSRLEFARIYLESSEFKYLPDELKELLRKHVQDRMALAAEEAAPAMADASIAPHGMPGVGGAIEPSLLGEEGLV